jgi:FAD synthase
MHFGPRPVFRDSESLEVHVLDTVVTEFPSEVEVDVLARLRDVAMFDTAQELQEAIAHDIALTRGILAACPSDRR